MPAAAQSPATAAWGQRPPSPVIALAPLGRSHLDARHPPHHSCNLPSRASSARQPAAPPCDRARLSNPHRPGARRTVLPSLPAVSSLGGFRTPAASARGKACERPASENLHRGLNRSRGRTRCGGTDSPTSCLEMRVHNLHSKTGAFPDEAISPLAHDRRHDDPHDCVENPTRLRTTLNVRQCNWRCGDGRQ